MITCTDVTKTFFSGRGVTTALDQVTFKIQRGSFTALIGKSGSGKSTLLNCVGGIEPPDKGGIRCFNVDLYTLSPHQLSLFQREKLGFVFQRGNLLSYLTVAENIGFPLFLNGYSNKARLKRIDELLGSIGLAGAAAALPHELSGGELQRVAIARAASHRPELLLADEPTASLDTATGKQIVELMSSLGKEYGCTIVMATHDQEITQIADRIICLRDGKINGGYYEKD
ncbi:MAG: ABC transporter ATP-binding protein [Desulfopila sp.]|jgi:putative ABC transport system ATP-binding protein|nr:ABC transporter ATP-binding protein [Desulfopila sp.]